MSRTVVIAFPRSFEQAGRIASHLGAELLRYEPDIFDREFGKADRIVAVMSAGIVTRAIAKLLRDKWLDPAVVVVSPDLSYAVPLVGGHHGANELAEELGLLGIRPVITTATEVSGKESVEIIARNHQYDVLNRSSTRLVNAAILDHIVPVYAVSGPGIIIAGPAVSVLLKKGEYIIGIGCRKGVRRDEVIEAVEQALSKNQISKSDIFVYVTTLKKAAESGLISAVSSLSSTLLFLDDDTINAQAGLSPSGAVRIGLSGVAEPCALAVSRRKELVMKKTVFGRVTIALAR